jgi:anthranilate synthase component I
MITEAEFRALAAQGYNRIPLVLESFADLDTPLSLYLKLANQRYTYLLESVVGGERFGRYSFIGLPAKVRIRVGGTSIEVEDRGGIAERHEGDPLTFLRAFMQRFRAAAPAAAGSPATSAMTPCGTSKSASPATRRRRPARSTTRRTCC